MVRRQSAPRLARHVRELGRKHDAGPATGEQLTVAGAKSDVHEDQLVPAPCAIDSLVVQELPRDWRVGVHSHVRAAAVAGPVPQLGSRSGTTAILVRRSTGITTGGQRRIGGSSPAGLLELRCHN